MEKQDSSPEKDDKQSQGFQDLRSNLEKLDSGLLMMGIKRSVDEAAYYVIEQQTFGHKALQTRHTYSSEVARVLDDVKLTVGLMDEIDGPKTIGGKLYQPEAQIAYYNGALYTLVHSLKDKIVQLLAVMFTEDQLPKAYKDLDSAKVKKFLDKNEALLKEIGIYHELEIWLDSANGPIGKTLRRRNDYHHYQNRQQLNKDLQNLKTARLMQQPDPQARLTDYGKQRMVELETESLERIKQENKKFQAEVLGAITENIEFLAQKLISHYRIPTDPTELTKIGADYTTFLSSLKIVNRTSKDKIQPKAQTMVDEFIKTLPKEIRGEVISIYLAGSAARGDVTPGSSDLNFYVITKNYSHTFESELPVTLTVLSKNDLFSAEHKKERFILWSDGLCIEGKEFKFDEKEFPQPGTALCLLLNRGVIEKLEQLQEEIKNLSNPNPLNLRLFTLKVVRTMMDYDYGVAMSNRPLYTPNRKEKIAHTRVAFPNDYRTNLLEKVYLGARLSKEDTEKLIDVYLENARSTYAHLLDIEKKLSI